MPDRVHIHVDDYRYPLIHSSIASHPLPERDRSRLLFYKRGFIHHHIFRELPGLIPEGSWLVFNNTRVIQARLVFRKSSGARIEVFCLEPVSPAEYQQSFESAGNCTWKCLVGNAKKWKRGPVSMDVIIGGSHVRLTATLGRRLTDGFEVGFSWDPENYAFSEIIESAGTTPIPPYLNRDAEASDRERYQTVYNRDPGSVAAPTAGLHFTREMLDRLHTLGIPVRELTLHVSAGTFVPIKHADARQHSMHEETVLVTRRFLEYWSSKPSGLIAVGTTTTRSLETLYWLGVRLLANRASGSGHMEFRQWENEALPADISLQESLECLIGFCDRNQLEQFHFSTGLMIVPGYRFRTIEGLLTNFHLPGSTLLLLVAAFIGDDWKKVYDSAQENHYRFLSYGDTSLLLPRKQ